jgi:hypothetical protein
MSANPTDEPGPLSDEIAVLLALEAWRDEAPLYAESLLATLGVPRVLGAALRLIELLYELLRDTGNATDTDAFAMLRALVWHREDNQWR